MLDVWDDRILVSCSAPNRAPCVLVGKLPEEGKEEFIVWTRLSSEGPYEELTLNLSWTVLGFRRLPQNDEKDGYGR